MELEGELEVAGVAGARDCSEGSGAKDAVRVVEWRRISDVEGFGSELQVVTLREEEGFAEHDIGFLQAGTANGIA